MVFNRQLFDKINRKYKHAHDDITNKYYTEKTLSREQFNILHELLWLLHEKERYDNGFYANKELPEEILNTPSFQQQIKDRYKLLKTKIHELQTLKQQKIPNFKYTFES